MCDRLSITWERLVLDYLRGLLKKYRKFWISAGYVYSIFDFFGVMLVLISLTYADKFGHFECSVHFWQLFWLDVFGSSSTFASSVSGTRKSHRGTRSGEYGDCDNIIVLFLPKKSRTNNDVWAGASSWCKSQFLFLYKSGRSWRLASRKLRITSR